MIVTISKLTFQIPEAICQDLYRVVQPLLQNQRVVQTLLRQELKVEEVQQILIQSKLQNQLNKYDEMHNNDIAFDRRSRKKENFFCTSARILNVGYPVCIPRIYRTRNAIATLPNSEPYDC